MNACKNCASDLFIYFNNRAFSDTRLYTKSRTFHVNSLLLSAHSPVFRRIIEQENEKDIFLDSFLDEEDEMEMIVSSLYRRENLVVDAGWMFTVAKFGVVYEIPWVSKKAVEFVQRELCYGNCIQVSRDGHRLKENFKFPQIAGICDEFLRQTKYVEEIVVSLENTIDDNEYLTLPVSFFRSLLGNELRRDEHRVVQLVKRWLSRDSNLIQAMEILPLLQLSQLYLVSKDFHTEFFEFLVASDKLTSEDKRNILELSAKSIRESKDCIVTGLGFSKEVPKDVQASKTVEEFLKLPTWLNCSFDDIAMAGQFWGANQFIHVEMFLTWIRTNPITVHEVRKVLDSVNLAHVTKEYTVDLVSHLQNHSSPVFPDDFFAQFEARVAAHDFSKNLVRQFANQELNSDQLKNLKLKKHTVTARPCGVARCWRHTLGTVDLKLKRDSFPLYKTGRKNQGAGVVEHSHNGDVWHVYFVVEGEIVSCYSDQWDRVTEKLSSKFNVNVICVGQ